MIYNKNIYYRILKSCPICDKEYDQHWKVVNHIRKTKDESHQSFLKLQEEEVVNVYINFGADQNIYDILYKMNNIFCGIAYSNIITKIIDKRFSKDELENFRKKRISKTMSRYPKTQEHNKKVSESVKKAWKDGKFNTKEYKYAYWKGKLKAPSMKGKNNPMYGKPAPHGIGRGKGGIRKDIGHYVRSTWEANICRIAQLLGREYHYEYNRFYISVDGKDYSYSPDLYFPLKDFYYEIKGHAKSSKEWTCNCSSCNKYRKIMPIICNKYRIKILIIGHYEYKRLRRIFKNRIPLWEK